VDSAALTSRTEVLTAELGDAVRQVRPALFDPDGRVGGLIDWALRDIDFRTALFRFVDCLPSLDSAEEVADHLRAYFDREQVALPASLRTALRLATGRWTAQVANLALRSNVRALARQFIAAETPAQLPRALRRLHAGGVTTTIDLLGERTVSEAEAVAHLAGYHALLGHAVAAGGGDVSLSVKVSAIDSQLDVVDTHECVSRLAERLHPLLEEAARVDALIYLDMEDHQLKELILDLFQVLAEIPGVPRLGCVLQAYLRDSEADLSRVVAIARRRPGRVSVRLVKGAYWDMEVALARQRGWPVPVFEEKGETDRAFARLATRLLAEADVLVPAIASHNAASVAHALAVAESLTLTPERYEFQLLYGMGEGMQKALVARGNQVRIYVPVGALLPGMAYLVRRLLENTANTSVLRRTFVPDLPEPSPPAAVVTARSTAGEGFLNEPPLDFSRVAVRSDFRHAIEEVRQRLGEVVTPVVGDRDLATDRIQPSVNPAHPQQVVAMVHQAGPEEVDAAIARATEVRPAWQATPVQQRAAYLRGAAAYLREHRRTAAAWLIFEAAKGWREADADVCEAIDFLEYYAAEMVRLDRPRRYGSPPGEDNTGEYVGRGVAVAIAPWNFPLAILTGMSTAALVAGNPVLVKPASNTPRIGRLLVEAFRAAGLPAGALQFLPGPGGAVGDALVRHRGVHTIVFTGSRAVGLSIHAAAAQTPAGQRHVKRVICEMGGKNAIIVDRDADLDEAVAAIVQSSFGYQGQKCSACSRVIAVGAVHEPLVERLAQAIESLAVGDPVIPGNRIGPLIDSAAQAKVERYLAIGRTEGRLRAQGRVPREGYYVAPALFTDIAPHHRLAREEIFGPVLAVLRVRDIEEAVTIALDTDYALTGGLFSRHPGHVAYVRERFRVGNLYINRGITGAIVGRQPFGGFALSGIGSQAGGPDYLLQFLLPRTISENTLRRGFAPEMLE
jgi:RHH-type proline utilization regulon transcriptional repressor/proline dehydrogenase/delta 1-pyrroline-5-carboxylate dehydrogenase